MKRCLELAQNGLGSVSPNPLVGAVVVYEEKIIGEGWHRSFGEAHAEVNAIWQCIEMGYEHLLPQSVLYVNLEPCSHYGKTPPCSTLILEKKIKQVIIGMRDPFEKVNGSGIQQLTQDNIFVIEGILEDACRELNKRFITFHVKKRPYVILKFAQTKDGFIAPTTSEKKIHWISNEYSRKLVHKWRSEEDAVLVGANTALHDNPQLTVRNWNGRNPLRISIDNDLSFPSDLNLFDGSAPTLIFNSLKDDKTGAVEYVRYDSSQSLPEQICKVLYERNIQSIIIEGGLRLLQEFINENMWDEARIFTSPVTFGDGISAPFITGKPVSRDFIAQDELFILNNK